MMGSFTTIYIYALRDPSTRAFRYVGHTVDPERRLSPGDPRRGGLDGDVEVVILEEVIPMRGRRLNYLSDPTVTRRLAYWKRTLMALGEELVDGETEDLEIDPGEEDLDRLRTLRPVRPRS